MYSQLSPRLSQRVQVGFFLVHLTLAAAQASQLSRSLGALGAVDNGLAPAAASPARVSVLQVSPFSDPIRRAVLGVGASGRIRDSGEWTAAIAEWDDASSAVNVTQYDIVVRWSSKVKNNHHKRNFCRSHSVSTPTRMSLYAKEVTRWRRMCRLRCRIHCRIDCNGISPWAHMHELQCDERLRYAPGRGKGSSLRKPQGSD